MKHRDVARTVAIEAVQEASAAETLLQWLRYLSNFILTLFVFILNL